MANGEAAAAAGMDVLIGTEDRRQGFDEINKTRDYIADRTGAVTAESLHAWTNSGATAPGTTPSLGWNGQGLEYAIPGYAWPTRLANKADVDWALAVAEGRVSKAGDTMSGHLFLPAASPATSGFTVCYINSDGRVSRGSSSRRYKKYIHDAPDLGDVFAAPLREYQMRVDGIVPDDHAKHIGYIAEELVGTDMERFVVVINDEVESIDFIALLLAQSAQLNDRLSALEARVADLEGTP